jgi:hypothetical protein
MGSPKISQGSSIDIAVEPQPKQDDPESIHKANSSLWITPS